jgi:hypothetical protein
MQVPVPVRESVDDVHELDNGSGGQQQTGAGAAKVNVLLQVRFLWFFTR